ncbi:MAG TPA: polyhydroxyalkanoate synthesis regulator [Armatimonadota bacterium]|nr:polyhydroxyalkanoate synthesis regulator [Armatimonadota bacterium]
MWDLVKKSLAFGIGAAVVTGDKLREFVDEAVSRGEMSRDEAKKFVDEVMKRGEEEQRNIQCRIREQVNKMLKEAGAADSNRVEALERRIQLLEEKLAAVQSASQLGEPIGEEPAK